MIDCFHPVWSVQAEYNRIGMGWVHKIYRSLICMCLKLEIDHQHNWSMDHMYSMCLPIQLITCSLNISTKYCNDFFLLQPDDPVYKKLISTSKKSEVCKEGWCVCIFIIQIITSKHPIFPDFFICGSHWNLAWLAWSNQWFRGKVLF